MAKNFHEQFSAEDVPLPSERSTGLVFTAVGLVVAYLWRGSPAVLTTALLVAGLLLTTSLVAPFLLKPLNIAWFRFALLLNKFVSPVVMFVLFSVGIVPFGLIMQLFRDPLRKHRSSTSYWIAPGEDGRTSSMSNQF